MSKLGSSLTTNDILIRMLRKRMSDGTCSAEAVPSLVKDVCRNERWKSRLDEQTGERWEFERFEDFVKAPLLGGLASSVDVLKKLCRDDPEAVVALEEALTKNAAAPK